MIERIKTTNRLFVDGRVGAGVSAVHLIGSMANLRMITILSIAERVPLSCRQSWTDGPAILQLQAQRSENSPIAHDSNRQPIK